ncbi:gem-associated protein 7 isoform X2 [Rhinolophus sinicus]
MSRGCAASEPASPPATTWGSGGGGGRNAGSAARCQPEPLQPSAGGSGGASRADLGERRLLVVGGGHFVSPGPSPGLPPRGQDPSARKMQTPLASPVPVLRLPRGPDGLSRGFAPDGRRAPLKPEVPETPESSVIHECRESQEQQARAALRERYLRSLLAMVGRQVSFTLHEGVHVTAHFGATDLDVANFYVSQLQTPIGVQAEALLRCSDIIAYTFKL